MQMYRYHAVDQIGKHTSGTLRADDPTNLFSLLHSRGLYCVSYHEKSEEKNVRKKLDLRTLAVMSRQLSAMLMAGVSLVEALDIMHLTTSKKATKELYFDLSDRVKRGYSLSSALNSAMLSVPPLFVHLVKSGEESGTIDQVLKRLSAHYEKEQKMRNKVTSAMMYPVILLVVTILVVVVLMTFVLPTFFTMFENVQLPWNTKFLIWLSNVLIKYGIALLLLILCSIPLIRAILLKPKVAYVVDGWKLQMPLFGKLNRVVMTSRFARTFATLFGNGIEVVESLEITNDVLSNEFVRHSIMSSIEEIKQGAALSKSLRVINVFDDLLHSMLYVGEQSGDLEGILNTVADYYDEEADNAISKMIALMEPLMIVVLALIIGFVLLSVIVPIYDSFTLVS